MQRLTRIDERTNTPIVAIVAVTAVAMAFGAIGNLRVVAAISNIAIMIVFIMVNVALLRVRTLHHADPPFSIPLSVGRFPVTAILAVAGVLVLLVLDVVALTGAAS